MDEKNILKLTRDQWIEKLKIGQHNPGTLEEMKIVLIQMKCLAFLRNGV